MLQILAEALLLAAGQRPLKRQPSPHDGGRGADRPGPYTPPDRFGRLNRAGRQQFPMS